MKQYLLTIYQPEGGVPSKEVLEAAMREVGAPSRRLAPTILPGTMR
jgi:hypothetical protein